MYVSKLFLDVSLPFPSLPSLLLPSPLLLFVYNVCLLNYSNCIMYSAQVLFQLFSGNLNTQLFYFYFCLWLLQKDVWGTVTDFFLTKVFVCLINITGNFRCSHLIFKGFFPKQKHHTSNISDSYYQV